MPKYLTKDEAFMKCKREGNFLVLEEVDFDRIKATLNIADSDVESAELIKKSLSKQNHQWNSVYKLYMMLCMSWQNLF